jgi:hypothetical protein
MDVRNAWHRHGTLNSEPIESRPLSVVSRV